MGANICEGCRPEFATARHSCNRTILRKGATFRVHCDCGVESDCAAWRPAELLTPWIAVWTSNNASMHGVLKTHTWVPDPVEPWCEQCGCTVTAAKSLDKRCGGA